MESALAFAAPYPKPRVKISIELLRLSTMLGFNPQKDAERNRRIWDEELPERMRPILAKLELLSGDCRTWESLQRELWPKRHSVESFPRGKVVPVELIQKLVLLWCCHFLFRPMRGVSDPSVLGELTDVAVWLLRSYGYKLPSERELMSPKHRWSDHQLLWRMVYQNDREEWLVEPPEPEVQVAIPMAVLS